MWFLWVLLIGFAARLANGLLNRATIYFSPDPVGNEEFEKYQNFGNHDHGGRPAPQDSEPVPDHQENT
jgi:hypothetical protein